MPTIVLSTSNNEVLGFVLIAGEDPIETGPRERDCVFTGVPMDSSLLELPASQLLQTNKNQEFLLLVEVTECAIDLSASLTNLVSFSATIADTQDGQWRFLHGDVPTDVGLCKLL